LLVKRDNRKPLTDVADVEERLVAAGAPLRRHAGERGEYTLVGDVRRGMQHQDTRIREMLHLI
jgi:hypothetical protein